MFFVILSSLLVILFSIIFVRKKINSFHNIQPIDGFNYESFKNKKIWIIGSSSGCGKSTLSLILSNVLEIPCLHMDEVRFVKNKSGFCIKPVEEKMKMINEFLENNDKWVIESHVKQSDDILLNSIDILIWLDIPLYICLYRVLKRSLHRVWFKEKLFNTENREDILTVLKLWSNDSILTATFRWYSKSQTQNEMIYKKYKGTSFHIQNYKTLNASLDSFSPNHTFSDLLKFRNFAK